MARRIWRSVVRDVHHHLRGRVSVGRYSVASPNSSRAGAGGRRWWSATFGLSSISPVFRIQPEHRSKLDSSPISGRMGTSRTFGKCPAITITSIRRESATSQRTRVTGLSTVPIPLIKRITIRTAQKSTSNWPSRPAGRVLSDESSLPKAITWRWMRRHPRTKRSLLSKGCFIKSHGTRLRPASSR